MKKHKKLDNQWQKKLNQKLDKKVRLSINDLEARGLVPPGIFQDPDLASQQMEEYKTKTKNSFISKFEQRMMPEEAIARNIIDKDHLSKDVDVIEKEKEEKRKKLTAKMDETIKQRALPNEVIARGVLIDEEELSKDINEVLDQKQQQKKKNFCTIR